MRRDRMAKHTIVCTNCELEIDYDPGAAGNKCPRCKNGALVPKESDLV